MEASGAAIGAKTPEEVELAELAVKENWYGKPLWEKKFRTWQILTEKSCIAKAGMGGRFCSWSGMACHYNACPRRIFEEYVPTAEIDRPRPTPDYVAELKNMQNQVGKLQRQLRKSNERIKDLEDIKKIGN